MPGEEVVLPAGCPPLTTFYFYLTEGCNLACRHCWIAPKFQPNGGTGGHLDYDLFSLAIEEGLRLGLARVKLTGGEPLLHPDFLRMIDLIEEKGLRLIVETNGTLLTRSLAHYLKDNSKLDLISVSLDGAGPESHDSFRGVKGSFERTCQGIRELVAVGYRPQLIMSLHPQNVGEIEAVVRLAEQLGAGSVKFNLIQRSGRGELMTERGQVLDIGKLIELGRWVEGDMQERTVVGLRYSWPVAFHSLRHLLDFGGGFCRLFNILGVLPTGSLAMCGIGQEIPDLCYGQLGRDPLIDIWTSHPVLVDIRKSLPAQLDGICAECLFRRQCMGDCVAQNYNSTKRLTAAYWFCEAAESSGLFPALRRL